MSQKVDTGLAFILLLILLCVWISTDYIEEIRDNTAAIAESCEIVSKGDTNESHP